MGVRTYVDSRETLSAKAIGTLKQVDVAK
ncbi:hypothetical protein METHB2_240006 [Candidatus Methylobacter favarea]|uniref:Uncharacterized protein n=1 Tax=Candidatus Methylobacter favarea TaxID=2707345 RepID=A0A8S0Y658_9GAMM|nr:hypothetical protein METHB2_240006 [Candidatus Methylobacter favarea]